MPENPSPVVDDCTAQALLYLTRELQPAESVAFEQRLEQDPQCQEALVAAVRLWPGLGAPHEPRPSPALRDRVRMRLHRLRHCRTLRERLLPFVYALGGGIAAALMLVVLNPARWLGPAPSPTLIVNPAPELSLSDPATEVIFSELSNTERLSKVRQQEGQRRQKQQEFKQHHSPLLNPMGNPPPMDIRSMM
jgi:hypothetical protein